MDSSQHPRPSLDKLPAELLHLIFLEVFPDDILVLRCVCRLFTLIGSEYPTREIGIHSAVCYSFFREQNWTFLEKLSYHRSLYKAYSAVRKTVGQTLTEDAAKKISIEVQGDQKL
ncbi:hypothetical protein D6C95_04801 [Aureobasidium pullulans]|nr:hypothetical protein D6C95_04801 [Aureobasidium pullulans]